MSTDAPVSGNGLLREQAEQWIRRLDGLSLAFAAPVGPRVATLKEQREMAEGVLALLSEVERLRLLMAEEPQ